MNNKVFNNAAWIIGCKIVQAVLGLIINMMMARYLGPSNFGIIHYAASLVAFVAPIMYLGLGNTIVREIIDNKYCEGRRLGTAITLNVISSVFCILGILAFVYIADKGDSTTLYVCGIYSVILFAKAVEMLQYWFQAKLMSKYTSLVMLFAYFTTAVYKIFILMTEKSIYWFAFSNTLDIIIIDVLLFYLYNKMGSTSLSFSYDVAHDMLERSKHYIIANMMVVVFAQTDKIMLKTMIDAKATGLYSAAVSCTGMTSFVFSAVIDSIRPLVFEAKNSNVVNYENTVVKLYSVIIYMSLAQSVFITLFADYIIAILFGAKFAGAAMALRVIVWYTTFSYMGAVRNIWILAEEKQHLLWKINLTGAAANVMMNLLMIPVWGIIGAAIASLITQFFTNVITGFFFMEIRYNNTLIWRSLDPRWGIKYVKAKLNHI